MVMLTSGPSSWRRKYALEAPPMPPPMIATWCLGSADAACSSRSTAASTAHFILGAVGYARSTADQGLLLQRAGAAIMAVLLSQPAHTQQARALAEGPAWARWALRLCPLRVAPFPKHLQPCNVQ